MRNSASERIIYSGRVSKKRSNGNLGGTRGEFWKRREKRKGEISLRGESLTEVEEPRTQGSNNRKEVICRNRVFLQSKSNLTEAWGKTTNHPETEKEN